MESLQVQANGRMENDALQNHLAVLLPIELIVRIGEVLAGDLCFGVLANLNVTCRLVHEESRSVLYDSMFLRYSEVLVAMFKKPLKERPSGWHCVK